MFYIVFVKGVEVLTLPTKVVREVITRELRGLAGLQNDLGRIGIHDTNHFTHSTPVRSKSPHDNFSTPSEVRAEVREVALTVRSEVRGAVRGAGGEWDGGGGGDGRDESSDVDGEDMSVGGSMYIGI